MPVLAASLGLLTGAAIAWIVGVLVLHLYWETTLLLVEVLAVAGAIGGALVVYLRRKAH
jgi:CDP-diglyceride synthetase